MAKVYLDANRFIDIVEKRKSQTIDFFQGHLIYVSPLAFHFYFYVHKRRVPHPEVNLYIAKMRLVNFTAYILKSALTGPTSDLEDNIQLHSAIDAECDVFLTSDKKPLKMSYFGKVAIKETLKLV